MGKSQKEKNLKALKAAAGYFDPLNIENVFIFLLLTRINEYNKVLSRLRNLRKLKIQTMPKKIIVIKDQLQKQVSN